VYVINITIPPIFVDNHVEPSKSAVNIQVGSPPSQRLCRRLTIGSRITRFYTPSSRTSSKSFWSEIRLPNQLLRFRTEMNQLKTRENDGGSQITRFPFIHQGHPNNHSAPRNLTTFPQNRSHCSQVVLNVMVIVTNVVPVVMSV